MESYVAPDGEVHLIYEGRILTFGLSPEQNKFVSCNMPTQQYDLYETDIATDIIAIHSTATIIVPSAFNEKELEMIYEYYIETINYDDETIFWIGQPEPPKRLKNKFKCYENFEQLTTKLRYLLLTAHTKQKKINMFSKKIADSLKILSLIRKCPGIKTKELASIVEMSERSVQRYIYTLQATGEWIEYDTSKRGWKLTNNISILFGDHLNDE